MLRQAFRPGSRPAKPSAFAPPHPHAASADVRSSLAASLPGRACPPSAPSSPPMRCPGSGLQCSRRLSASKTLRPPWRSRGATASPDPAGGGDPASAATATCWRTKCRDAAVSTRTKAPGGLESCRLGGASFRGLIGECRSGASSGPRPSLWTLPSRDWGLTSLSPGGERQSSRSILESRLSHRLNPGLVHGLSAPDSVHRRFSPLQEDQPTRSCLRRNGAWYLQAAGRAEADGASLWPKSSRNYNTILSKS